MSDTITELGKERLEKLIGFIETLPKEKFYFGSWKNHCGTTAWAVTLFPELLEWHNRYDEPAPFGCPKDESGGIHALSDVFEVSSRISAGLFIPLTTCKGERELPLHTKPSTWARRASRILAKLEVIP